MKRNKKIEAKETEKVLTWFEKFKSNWLVVTIGGLVVATLFTYCLNKIDEYYTKKQNILEYREHLINLNKLDSLALRNGDFESILALINETKMIQEKYSKKTIDSLEAYNFRLLGFLNFDAFGLDINKKTLKWLDNAEMNFIKASDLALKNNLYKFYFALESNLADVYTTRSDFKDKQQSLLKAIDCYNNSLKFIAYAEPEYVYGCYYNKKIAFEKLGEVYCNESYYDSAYKYFNLANFLDKEHKFEDKKWLSLTLGNLILHYGDLKHNKDSMISAITILNTANSEFSSEKDGAEKYYSVEINLADAYIHLSSVINSDTAALKALEILNEVKDACAKSQITNGTFYKLYSKFGHCLFELARFKDAVKNLNESIEYYNSALGRLDFNDDYVEIANLNEDLGDSYSKLFTIQTTVQNKTLGLTNYNQSLKVFTKESYPCDHDRVTANKLKLSN